MAKVEITFIVTDKTTIVKGVNSVKTTYQDITDTKAESLFKGVLAEIMKMNKETLKQK